MTVTYPKLVKEHLVEAFDFDGGMATEPQSQSISAGKVSVMKVRWNVRF